MAPLCCLVNVIGRSCVVSSSSEIKAKNGILVKNKYSIAQWHHVTEKLRKCQIVEHLHFHSHDDISNSIFEKNVLISDKCGSRSSMWFVSNNIAKLLS